MKKAIVAAPERFIERHGELPRALAMFRDHGKKLFLLTNSEPHYTQAVMSYLLDGASASMPGWNDYFDVVVVSAGKPGFFRSNKPVQRLRADEIRRAGLPEAARGRLFQGGGARALEDVVGHGGEEILYVGDHTFGDILRAKAHSRWRTAMVVEELEREIELERRLAHRYHRLDGLVAERNRVLLDLGRSRRRLQALGAGRPGPQEVAAGPALEATQRLQARIAELEAESARAAAELRLLREIIERRFNPHWGKLFKCGEVNSRFGHQVKDFACIYTSAVRNFLAYPESMYFRSPREIMPHEMGPGRE